MGCNGSQNCRCRPGVIAFVFMPGIMGTRLKNAESGETVWDPGAGLLDTSSSGALLEAKKKRQEEMEAAGEIDDSGYYSTGICKWLTRKKDQISLLVDESEKLVDVFSQKESTLSKVKKSVGVGLKVKELYDAKEEIIDYVKEGRRIASRWGYGISSISDFIFAGPE